MGKRRSIVGILILLPLTLGLSACGDIKHSDLVEAAEAVGERCKPPNQQSYTDCGNISFVDGVPELARASYEGRCAQDPAEPPASGAWVWYEEDSDWELEASPTIKRESVRVISDKLGVDARDCRQNQG